MRALSFSDKYGPPIGGGALIGRRVRRRSDGVEGVVRQQRTRSLLVWDGSLNRTFRDGTYDVLPQEVTS